MPEDAAATPPVRVAIVTDVRLYREGLAQVLARQRGVAVVATIAPTEGALTSLTGLQPHLVLADSTIVRGTDLARRVLEAVPAAKLVAFAVTEEDEEEVVACAEAGVAGFVSRDASAEELAMVLTSAAVGGVHCSPRVAGLMVRRVAALAAARPLGGAHASLTHRENEVVALIDAGLSNKEIGCALGIETATVKNHVHSLLEKLNVHRRAEAAAIVRMKTRGGSLAPSQVPI